MKLVWGPVEEIEILGTQSALQTDAPKISRNLKEMHQPSGNGPFRVWENELTRLKKGVKLVLFEVCCAEESGLKGWSNANSVAYFGLTEDRSVLGGRTGEWVKFVLDMCVWQDLKVLVHFSTPCTAGSPFRHLNLHLYPQYKKKYQAKLRKHREMWKQMPNLFEPERRCTFVQEWPEQTMLWNERVYKQKSEAYCMKQEVQVSRCVF